MLPVQGVSSSPSPSCPPAVLLLPPSLRRALGSFFDKIPAKIRGRQVAREDSGEEGLSTDYVWSSWLCRRSWWEARKNTSCAARGQEVGRLVAVCREASASTSTPLKSSRRSSLHADQKAFFEALCECTTAALRSAACCTVHVTDARQCFGFFLNANGKQLSNGKQQAEACRGKKEGVDDEQ